MTALATSDFPAMADMRDQTQPVPRRLRGVVAGVTAFDTVSGGLRLGHAEVPALPGA